jgi:hypothetical protein
MYVFLILALGQVGQLPPPPAPSLPPAQVQSQSPDASTASVEELKVWLLTRMIVELSFNEEKISEFEKRLDKMSERQVRMLIEFYKERVAKREQAEAARQQYMQAQVLNQAQLDLTQAQAYRDHLAREYQQRILQGQMETNLVRQNILNQQRMGYGNYGYNRNGYYPGGGFY